MEREKFICHVCNFQGLSWNKQRHLESKRHHVRTNFEKVYQAVVQSDPENNRNSDSGISDPDYIPNYSSSDNENSTSICTSNEIENNENNSI